MINVKGSLSFAALLCFVAADVAQPGVVPPVLGVPRPMPRPSLVRPLAVKTTTSSAVQKIPETKPMFVPKPTYSQPPQRVNLRPNFAPPGGPRPYPKPISVSTLPPSTETPLEQTVTPNHEELPAEEAELTSSSIIPVQPDVVEASTPITTTPVPARSVLNSNYDSRFLARPIPVAYNPTVSSAPVAPVVTEPDPTTVVESQSITIEPLPVESGLEWASSQPTLEELGQSEILITEPEPVPTPAPIKPIIKIRPSFSVQPKPSRTMSVIIKPNPIGRLATIVKPVGAVKPVPKPIISSPLGMTCAAENGYFQAGQDCDSYIECKKNIPIEYICPDGLHFNPEAIWPNYPCGYPSEVQCAGRTSKQPHPTEECPRQYGFFAMDSVDCSKYIMCQEGKATVMDCPPGLAFSVAVNSCDWPENVPACNPGVFQGFQCPEAPLEENGRPSDLIINYKYGDSCRSYVACQRGRPRLLSCDEGFSFDNMSARCIESDYVKNCEL